MAEVAYEPAVIEPKWQKFWQDQGLFRAERDPAKPKFYLLCMYPYPSGVLHMGHVVNYTIGDALVRFHLMRGYNVFSPMGWDSFGLPAENAAIRLGIHPAEFTRKNINRMREQMRRAGWGYDWRREIACSHPGYYRWTQWLFLRFFEKGLAYKKRAPVNWCPSCQTVLANEQVHDGQCERCNTQVEQRDLEQWFFAMSRYAQRLLDQHKLLKDGWPEKVIKMQEEWIGRSEGARIDFTVAETGEKLSCFTTRPDTLYGVTFMSLAPEHPLIERLVKGTPQEKNVMTAVREMRRQGTSDRERLDMEKVGVFTGFHVINPVNGEKVPLWVANFAIMTYGAGAVMSVPAHDQRDFEFAKKYNIPIHVVIQPAGQKLDPHTMTAAYVDDGVQVNSGPFDGIPNREAMGRITRYLEEKGWGQATVTYRLRDWLLSRQRYWGAPIPIIYCPDCGAVPVPDKDLPVLLPENVEFRPTGESPLALCKDFVNTKCPKCGKPARRETDTMDTFVDSSWYYLRYVSPRNETAPFDKEDVRAWLPVDQYIGGSEHSTMHLVYFRFFAMVLKDLGMIEFDEPAMRLFCQGMVCKVAHFCQKCKWVPDAEVENGKCKKCGQPVASDVAKMSKTKLNTVSPDDIMTRFGADTLRLYILSDSPPERDTIWNEQGLLGAARLINRLWSTVHENDALKTAAPEPKPGPQASKTDRDLYRKAHATIKSATQDLAEEKHFNTLIARVNELLSETRSTMGQASPAASRFAVETMVKLMAPIIPHAAEEMWVSLGNKPSVFQTPWPEFDAACLAADVITMPVQVNGKLRGHVSFPPGTPDEDIERLALENDKITPHLAGKSVRKIIMAGRKLINIVAN
ncbi:MAG TPA: leucine--tRNA ligase [Candidatus Brocadiia bacterium]|nr:leucine--tRNA ligase [Candidatus Brocadiia bacterium]